MATENKASFMAVASFPIARCLEVLKYVSSAI